MARVNALILLLLVTFIFVKSELFLHHTYNGVQIQSFDCVFVHSPSIFYCRRPKEPIVDLVRKQENDTKSCLQNGGQMHLFSELRLNNVTINTLHHHRWTTTIEQLEEYSLFWKDPSLSDGYLCQCLKMGAFGINCEYQLPIGKTFEETLQWQLAMRAKSPEEVQMYGDVVCYEMLKCQSGVLCLDWREICDGIQQCLEGQDEENCDLLEMNICDDDEYRCDNGMCIAEEFFLDGEYDCLDWSDETELKNDRDCPQKSVSTECDDHCCSANKWSCGDGQCIADRLHFQKMVADWTCVSGRDQYFNCETHLTKMQWTMPNGRCHRGERHEASSVTNRSVVEQCEYLLRCTLSRGGEKNCLCNSISQCAERLKEDCLLPVIQYPRGTIVTPYTLFIYNPTRSWKNSRPDWILINGTVRCRHFLVTVKKFIAFDINLDVRRMIEEHFCRSSLSNISSPENIVTNQQCHRANESTDRCDEWNGCLSVTRINDGQWNCLNRRDEVDQTEMQIEKSCAHVRRHRLRCSTEQPTCLSVKILGDLYANCQNEFDELWFGVGRTLSSINCHDRSQDECSLLRRYIEQSWTSAKNREIGVERRIPFRSYCDTFKNLETQKDEDLTECQQWWICLDSQQRCVSGQCFQAKWADDMEWDCVDASDEYGLLKSLGALALYHASVHNFNNRSYFVPDQCNESDPFLCLASHATRQGFSCFNLSQISDGHIDCAGAIDERNTLRHCSHSSVLGYNFQCPSTNTCIPYWLHCFRDDYRCPNRSDDRLLCERQQGPSDCSYVKDFVCFDGQCFNGGRCNGHLDCPFGEDEYMCDYRSSSLNTLWPYRLVKRFEQGTEPNILRFSPYPADGNITQLDSHSITTLAPLITSNIPLNSPSLLSPFWCNRGLGLLISHNDSIVCFCPPQYYGGKCEYHAGRLSVLLHLDLSESIFINEDDPTILLKLLVLFIHNDEEVLQRDQFHFHPSIEVNHLYQNTGRKKKIISHFVYPRTFVNRQQRFFNRSSLLSNERPFSLRIELYRTIMNKEQQPSLISVWSYPLSLDHLPVTRLAKVLHLASSSANPCSSRSCSHPNEECHPLMNNKSRFICLCKTNFTGDHCSIRNPLCDQQYCHSTSLCQSRSPLPFCLCSANRFGQRCSLEHVACLSNPCLNNGSCFPDSHPDHVICLCTKEYAGSQCQWKRASIHLSLSTHLSYAGVVIQFFDIHLSSLDLILVRQQVFKSLPDDIDFYYPGEQQTVITGIVLVKLYSSHQEDLLSELHLLSLYVNVFSLVGTTEISPINQCSHVRSFIPGNLYQSKLVFFILAYLDSSSPIRYHYICRDNLDLLCFRDDLYLCVCSDNHTRVECFLYNDDLDRCSSLCLQQGRCLKGDHRRSRDFLCLCPPCHSGRQCQFNTESFSFTLDQLFSPDLLSDLQLETISLLAFFSILMFIIALPNNLFSFITLHRASCLRQGVGHYLLTMSVINQISLTLLLARLLHLILNITRTSSSSSSVWIDDFLCKSLNYLLSCSTRLVYWLTSLISIERLYATVFLRGQWLKQPRIARRLILFIFVAVFTTDLYELFFYRSFSTHIDGHGSLCVLNISAQERSLWITVHLLFLLLNSLLPFLINLLSTLIIIIIIINKKINTSKKTDPSQYSLSPPD